MPIPVNPIITATAGIYTPPTIGYPMPTCKLPNEGLKCTPMQFTFGTYVSWLVNMGGGNPQPLSQVCSLYVDATQSTHDVNINFPDTGYNARIPLGSCGMVPAVTGSIQPTFYVTLMDNVNVISLPGPNNTDIVNVTAINQFIPPFISDSVSRSLLYGLGDFFAPTPVYVSDDLFNAQGNITTAVSSYTQNIISHTEWYLNGGDISIIANTSDGSTTAFNFVLQDNATAIMQKSILVNAMEQFYPIFNFQNKNYRSSGTGNLSIFVSTGNILNATLSSNVDGGILIS